MISLKWGSTIEEHDQRLRSFATREGVYLKLGIEIFEVREIEVNYVGQVFTHNELSDVSASLRKLRETSSGSKWKWTKEQDVSFKLFKTMITEAPVLAFYNPKLPLTLSGDASSKGLCATILQQGRTIAYAS